MLIKYNACHFSIQWHLHGKINVLQISRPFYHKHNNLTVSLLLIISVVWKYCDHGMVGRLVAKRRICFLLWVPRSKPSRKRLANGEPETHKLSMSNGLMQSDWNLYTMTVFLGQGPGAVVNWEFPCEYRVESVCSTEIYLAEGQCPGLGRQLTTPIWGCPGQSLSITCVKAGK